MNNKFRILVNQALEKEFQPKQQEAKLMPKLVLIAFILLLAYLIIDGFYSNGIKSNEIRVFGFYSGVINKNQNNEIIVKLNDKQNFSNNEPPKEEKPVVKPELIVKPKLSKKDLIKNIKAGTKYDEVIELIGEPSKNLSVNHGSGPSGFEMFVWEGNPKIVLVFFKKSFIKML